MKWETIEKESHPIKGGRWVRAVAHIRKNETGEIRQFETHEVLYDGEEIPSVFNWKENNYSCDCNRELFFERAEGNEIETEECSDGRFSVNLVNPITGGVYYREFSSANATAQTPPERTGRVILSLSMDANSLSVIPALDSSNRDKLLALLVSETATSKVPRL